MRLDRAAGRSASAAVAVVALLCVLMRSKSLCAGGHVRGHESARAPEAEQLIFLTSARRAVRRRARHLFLECGLERVPFLGQERDGRDRACYLDRAPRFDRFVDGDEGVEHVVAELT
jgi:hypothetical protein